MNINDIDLETQQIPNTAFQFSGARVEDLDASEYTLVTIAVDCSGSTIPFQSDLVKMLNAIIEACKKSPRRENLLVRVISFGDSVSEVNGFVPLASIGAFDRQDLHESGMTALIDASLSSIAAMNVYGKKLVDAYYTVNGIFFVITDGAENRSICKDPSRIRAEIDRAVKGETISGVTAVLVGINIDECKSELESFEKSAGFNAFVKVADATPGRLAHLAGFVSKSISSSSQSLAQRSASPITIDPSTLSI